MTVDPKNRLIGHVRSPMTGLGDVGMMPNPNSRISGRFHFSFVNAGAGFAFRQGPSGVAEMSPVTAQLVP
jgi:hypothetical protein